MSAPQVSVVMGVFNAATTVAGTIRSVLEQLGVDLELIVIDDGSTDGTSRLLDELAAADARLRVIHQENAGLTKALIRGCAQACGEFIARQDAGDLSLPGRLLAEADFLQKHPDVVFVSCATEYAEESGVPLYTNAGSGRARTPMSILDLSEAYGVKDGPTHHGAVMFRRDAYLRAGGYRADFYFGQDWDLWYRLAQQGKFASLGQVLYQARIGPGDISSTRRPQQQRLAQLSLEALRCRLGGQPEEPALQRARAVRPTSRPSALAVRRARAGGNYFIGECLRRNGHPALARRYFGQALKELPLHAKSWVRWVQAALATRPRAAMR